MHFLFLDVRQETPFVFRQFLHVTRFKFINDVVEKGINLKDQSNNALFTPQISGVSALRYI